MTDDDSSGGSPRAVDLRRRAEPALPDLDARQRRRGVPLAGHPGHVDPRRDRSAPSRAGGTRWRGSAPSTSSEFSDERHRDHRVLRRLLLPQRVGHPDPRRAHAGPHPGADGLLALGRDGGRAAVRGDARRRGPVEDRRDPGHARVDLLGSRAHRPRGRPAPDGRPPGVAPDFDDDVRRRARRRGSAATRRSCGGCSRSTCTSPTARPSRSG